MYDQNRDADAALRESVANLTAHNDETADGKLDAADLKAQLNRIEAQLELQDKQNRAILRSQTMLTVISIVLAVILLAALIVGGVYAYRAYNNVIAACDNMNALTESLTASLESIDAAELEAILDQLPAIAEKLAQVDVDALNELIGKLPDIMDIVAQLQEQVQSITKMFSGLSGIFG